MPGRVAQAEAAPLAHLEFLELLVEDEFVRRADRLFARRLKQAGIVTITTLADFDWHFNPKLPKAKLVALASARFVQTHGGVLLIGPPGVGNFHVAVALSVAAIRAGHRALIRSTFDLAADFAQADATGTRRELMQHLTRVDLLVLEDFGMKKLGGTTAEDLLEVFVRRHETASTVITTNRPTQDWGTFLGDVPAATAILDRFLAHAEIVHARPELSLAHSLETRRRIGVTGSTAACASDRHHTTIATPAWPLFNRSAVAAFERSVTVGENDWPRTATERTISPGALAVRIDRAASRCFGGQSYKNSSSAQE